MAEDGLGWRQLTRDLSRDFETEYVFPPNSNDVSPSRTKLYVPAQTADEVVVIDHEHREVIERIDVGTSSYRVTSAQIWLLQ